MNQCYLSSLSSSIPSLQPRSPSSSSSSSSSHSRRLITTVPSIGPQTNVRSRFTRLAAIKPLHNPHNNDNDNKENLSQNRLTQAQLANRNHSLPSLSSAAAMAEMDQLTSGASNRIIPIVKAVRAAVVFLHALAVSLFVVLLPRRRRRHAPAGSAASEGSPPAPARMRKTLLRMEEEDTARRRALAEGLDMSFGPVTGDLGSRSRWANSLFYGVRCNALFCRSWVPVSGQLKGILIIIHGLNEHSGRYVQFARQLNSCNYGVYAMDWIGHGGSDGLHGYVPSLEHVVADTGAFLEKIKSENSGVPCFLFGHSTGGAVVLKATLYPHIQEMLEGIVLTSPALRVRPAHPIVGAIAPIFSLLAPKFQFKGANKRGIPVTRDPVALSAKYSDPLVYTGPIRVRTGHEILRISSYLMRNFKSVTVPFFILHGKADTVTDPLASQDLYNDAPSKFKDIRLYDGLLHDLLFEPEREEIGQDIIKWMEKRLCVGLKDVKSLW